eukprot:scaffold3984_cov65-Phaeocystis_antarctica.AAC.6
MPTCARSQWCGRKLRPLRLGEPCFRRASPPFPVHRSVRETACQTTCSPPHTLAAPQCPQRLPRRTQRSTPLGEEGRGEKDYDPARCTQRCQLLLHSNGSRWQLVAIERAAHFRCQRCRCGLERQVCIIFLLFGRTRTGLERIGVDSSRGFALERWGGWARRSDAQIGRHLRFRLSAAHYLRKSWRSTRHRGPAIKRSEFEFDLARGSRG